MSVALLSHPTFSLISMETVRREPLLVTRSHKVDVPICPSGGPSRYPRKFLEGLKSSFVSASRTIVFFPTTKPGKRDCRTSSGDPESSLSPGAMKAGFGGSALTDGIAGANSTTCPANRTISGTATLHPVLTAQHLTCRGHMMEGSQCSCSSERLIDRKEGPRGNKLPESGTSKIVIHGCL